LGRGGASEASIACLVAVFLALIPALGQARDNNASRYYEDALTRFEKRDAAGAIVQLKNALQQDPKMIAAHVLLGRALLQTGDAAAAEDAFMKAQDLGVSRSEIAVPMAQALYDQGKVQDLLERFPPEAAATSAQRVELLVLRGHAYRSSGDLASAARSYEQARALDPRHIPTLLSQADLLAQSGKRSEAYALIDQAIGTAPGDPSAWQSKAAIAHAAGDVAAALAAYDKTLSIDPGFIEARIGRAGLLIDLNRLDQADADMQYLAREAPKEPRALYLKAVLLSKRGDAAGARDALLEVTRILDPIPPEVLKRRLPQGLLLGGLTHYSLNQTEKAREYLAAYVLVTPRHPGSRKLLGSIYLKDRNFREALSVLEAARRDAPNDPDLLALLAAAYMGRGQYQTASSLLDQALQLSGNAPGMQASLGFSLLNLGQRDLGMEHLQRAFAKDTSQTRVGMALIALQIKRGDKKAALDVAETLARRQPKSAIVQNMLGVTRLAAGNRTGARAAYAKAAEIDPNFVAAQLNLSRLDLADGNAAAARGRLQAVLKARPTHAQAMIELALVEQESGNPAEALRWLEKVHAMDRRNVQATGQLVEMLIASGKPDKALEVAKETMALLPEDLGALASLGRAHAALGDKKQAQVAFDRMTRIAAFDTGWQYRIAQYQLRIDNAEGATYSLEKVLSAQPDHLPAQVLLAEVELQRGQFDKAEQRARSIIAARPSEAVGHRLLGDIALAQTNATAAVGSYRSALKLQADSDNVLRLYRAYFAAGQDRAALDFLESWSRTNPRDALSARALADGYLRTGNLTAARVRYEALLKSDPDNPALLNNLANVLDRQGDPRALEYAQRAHERAPQSAAAQDTLGWLLVKQGQLEAGLRHLREARLRAPQVPEIRYHLAAALAQMGRTDEARVELNEALREKVAFEEVEAARELWKKLSTP
jgi:putative PEP-CTERM system TPR-repeat lipoprotein